MRAVVGVSLGASAVRAAIMDPMGRALLGTESVAGAAGDDRLASAVQFVSSICDRHDGDRSSAVLVVPDDPQSRIGHTALSVFDGGCVRLASELGAQLIYLRMRGLVEPGTTVAVVDTGKSGTSVSVVDVSTGYVHDATWTDRFRGSAFADTILEHVMAAYASSEPMSATAAEQLSDGVDWAMEMLALHRVVRVGGPFVGGTVNIWRTTVDRLMLDYVTDTAEWVSTVLRASGRRIDGVVLAGGPANLPLFRGVYSREWGERMIMPPDPQTFAAKGAALLAARRAADSGRVPVVAPSRRSHALVH